MQETIDFVITWVDGNDPEWQKEKFSYLPDSGNDVSISRYRDWETLRYWFRGVDKFAPWVNKIFFVTWGHIPEWLDTNNPKLRVIKHNDFIPNEYLPTFNSNVIEYYFHNIKELSEHFVYFNDDFFIIDHVTPQLFFRHGLPCDVGGLSINLHSGLFGSQVMTARTIINNHFNKREVLSKHFHKWFNLSCLKASLLNIPLSLFRRDEFLGFVNPHIAQGYLKSSWDEVWNTCREDLIRTSKNKFRSYGDVCFWLIRYWQLVTGKFTPHNLYNDGSYFLVTDDNFEVVLDFIRNQKKKLFCLNDSEQISNFEEAKARLLNAFNDVLPEKCSFEIPENS